MNALNLTRSEWVDVLAWVNAHGYDRAPGETLDTWRDRTAPMAYAYALMVEAACEHRLSAVEPYCALCGALMEG